MHNAPAVSFPVGRSRFQGGLLGVLAGLGFLSVLVWGFVSDSLGWRHWTAVCSCVVIFAWVGWSWWRTDIGSLSWDGVVWHWEVAARSVAVLPEAVLDLQSALLLRLQVAGGGRVVWVWLDCASNPFRWLAMRRAIFGRIRRDEAPSMDSRDTSPVTRSR